jgi:hypothetical protein
MPCSVHHRRQRANNFLWVVHLVRRAPMDRLLRTLSHRARSRSVRASERTYVSRLKMLCDRLVVCGRILVGHAPFSDSASHPALLGTSGESMSYTAA